MNVIQLPLPQQEATESLPSAVIPDPVLHEMLRKAVASYRTGEDRVPGSLSHRHHLAVAHAYLDAIAVVLGSPGIAHELAHCLDAGIFEVRRLTRIARDYDGPASA